MAGPNPTFASCWTQFGLVVKIVNELEKFGSTNSANYEDMEDAVTVGTDGIFTPSSIQLLRQTVRTALAGALDRGTLRRLFRPFLLEILRAIGSQELSASASVDDGLALRAIRQYMVDNTQTLNSNEHTYDTSSAGSPAGTGAIYRITVDPDAKTLDCLGADDKTFYCVQDQNSGVSKHAEVFEVRREDANPDGLQWTGGASSPPVRIASLHAKSANLLVNPSFEVGAVANATALTTTGQLTGWDVTTAANLKTYSAAAYVYRGYANDTGVTHYGVEFVGNDTLIQVVKTENPGASFFERTPYRCQIAWQRLASATGTLTLHLGAKSKAVDVSTGSNGAWNILTIDMDEDAYLAGFNETALDVKVDMASLAVGTVVVDDLVLAPMTNLDGTWWAVVGGATPWKRGDNLAFTADAFGGTRGIMSYWLWRAYVADDPGMVERIGGWLPVTAGGTETIADPA